jgi:hypothetical protein
LGAFVPVDVPKPLVSAHLPSRRTSSPSGKDVDPDIAVLKEAKAAEYEKLK